MHRKDQSAVFCIAPSCGARHEGCWAHNSKSKLVKLPIGSCYSYRVSILSHQVEHNVKTRLTKARKAAKFPGCDFTNEGQKSPPRCVQSYTLSCSTGSAMRQGLPDASAVPLRSLPDVWLIRRIEEA